MDSNHQLLEVVRTLESYGVRTEWKGSDAYEGLNATRFVRAIKRTAFGRRLLTQVVKRSPGDLRPLLGIHPTRNAAGMAWVLSAYTTNGFLPDAEAQEKVRATARLLASMRIARYEEPCWGYPFDFQSRVFFYPKGDPNTIATAFAGMALLDAFDATGDEQLLELAAGAGEFFLRHIPQTPGEKGAYFGYLVGDRTPIQNANTHICALLARLDGYLSDQRMRAAAEAGVEYALHHQRPDGSWHYGDRDNLRWVDGFHTGYVLDSLRVCADAQMPGVAISWQRGLQYYRENLFLSDGTPKYFVNAVYPIDGQSVAQAIQTFAIASAHDKSYAADAWRVFEYAQRCMRRSDGLFIFQRRRYWTNSLPHMRWVLQPMLLALVHLLDQTHEVPPAESIRVAAV